MWNETATAVGLFNLQLQSESSAMGLGAGLYSNASGTTWIR